MLNYAGDKNVVIGQSLLAKSYTKDKIKLINENKIWIDNVTKSGINVNSMVTGKVERTQEFGVESGVLTLESSTIPDAKYFWEEHTGIDYAGAGTGLHTPGGNWELLANESHRATFGLFGSALKMRIMHLDPKKVANLDSDKIYNESNGTAIIDYPKTSNGAGTGAHIHIDFTNRLSINGGYQRQFINPATVQPGSRFEYSCWYKDKNNQFIKNYPSNQYRY